MIEIIGKHGSHCDVMTEEGDIVPLGWGEVVEMKEPIVDVVISRYIPQLGAAGLNAVSPVKEKASAYICGDCMRTNCRHLNKRPYRGRSRSVRRK